MTIPSLCIFLKKILPVFFKMDLIDIPLTSIGPGCISRPILPIEIINPKTQLSIKTYGFIDTGADDCAVPGVFANKLGHNLTLGDEKEINLEKKILKTYFYRGNINYRLGNYHKAIEDYTKLLTKINSSIIDDKYNENIIDLYSDLEVKRYKKAVERYKRYEITRFTEDHNFNLNRSSSSREFNEIYGISHSQLFSISFYFY